ncbi:glycosyltransferase [Actinoplanes sp. CA-015351]|uniref:glycosyltransferase n=1 Tax=Actinoplanes sp. CA-015351 TaxID=3239897 RepID=UPI003D956DAF
MSVVIAAGDVSKLPVLLGALPPVDEVVVVVGRNDDTTRALPRGARTIRQTRTGAGNALACGVDASTGDVVVTLPGDGSCDPAEMPRLLDALLEGADVVHGSRYLTGRPGVFDMVVLWFLRVLFDCRPTDPGHGFRAFWRDSVGQLGLPRVAGLDPVRGDGAEIEPLLAVRTASSGLRGAEVPTTVLSPASGSSPLTAVRALVAEHFERRRGARAGAPSSIVVLTGKPGAPSTAGKPAAATAAPAHPLINKPGAGARPGVANGTTWPAPNQRSGTAADHPNSRGLLPGTPGFVERRHGGERRNSDRARATGNQDRRRADLPFAGRGWGKPRLDAPDNLARRQWRDNRTKQNVRDTGGGRPNLRVINGEGTGPTTRRNGHLRSV